MEILLLLAVAAIIFVSFRVFRRLKPAGRLKKLKFGELFDRADVLILDVETTGLGDRAEIVEIAIVDTTGATRYSAPVMPQSRISTDASDIHGLTRKRLKQMNARPWPEHHEAVADLMAQATVVLGWNVGFDWRLLEQTARRYGLKPPVVVTADLLQWYRELRPGKRARLIDALQNEGVKGIASLHRAEADCRAVLALMDQLRENLSRPSTRKFRILKRRQSPTVTS